MKLLDAIVSVKAEGAAEAKKSIEGLKGSFSDLIKEIPGASQALEGAESAMSALRAGAGAAVGPLGAVALGAVALTAALGGLGIAAAFSWQGKIDELGDLGDKFGLTANETNALKRALEDAGTSIDTFIAGGDKLAKSMAKSGDESKGAGEAFARLGVSTTDAKGNLKSVADVGDELAEKFSKGTLTAQQQADMSLVLGKNWRETLVAIREAKVAGEEHAEAMKLGLGITEGSKQASADYEKALRLGNKALTSMGSVLVETVMPAITKLIGAFVDSYVKGGFVRDIFNAIALAAGIAVTAIKGFVEMASIGLDGIMSLVKAIAGMGAAVVALFSGDFAGAKNIAAAVFDDMATKADELKKRTVQSFKDIGTGLKDAFTNVDKAGDAMVRVRKENTADPNKFRLQGSAGGKPDEGKKTDSTPDPDKAINALIDALTKQTLAQETLNKVQVVTIELEDEKYSKADKALKQMALNKAALIDEANAKKFMTEATTKLNDMVDDYVTSLAKETSMTKEQQREYNKQLELKKIDIQLTRDLKKLKEQGLDTDENVDALFSQRAEAIGRVETATKKASDADKDWLNNGFKQFEKSVGTVDEAMTNWVSGSLDATSKSMVSLFTTGEGGFKQLAKTIITSLAEMAVQLLIVIPLFQLLKSLMGGGTAAASGTTMTAIPTGKAAGDVLNKPTTFMAVGGSITAGEAGEEAIMPLKRTAGGDLGVQVAGGSAKSNNVSISQNVTVNGNINNKDDVNTLLREMKAQTTAIVNQALARGLDNGGVLRRA